MSIENLNPKTRIPPLTQGIQVNTCQNPNCENFGIPATEDRKDPCYTKVAVRKLFPAIQCKSCNSITTIKSNLAIYEEYIRFSHPADIGRAARHVGYSCPHNQCENYLKKLDHKNYTLHYRKRGQTSKGNERFQCKSCGRTFTVGSKKFREQVVNYKASHEMLFKELVNLSPLKRISEKLDTGITDIHRKLDLFYERCILFSNDRESRLPKLPIENIHLSTDRQDYIVNWSDRKDKRTTQIGAIGSACLATGYIFGMELNFDSSIHLSDVLDTDEYKNEIGLGYPFRKYARIWTPNEVEQRKKANRSVPRNTLEEIELRAMNVDGDRSAYELMDENKLPPHGVLVHSEYTQYAHFLRLRDLLGHARKIVFYTDQEAGIVNAVNNAFSERISSNDVIHMLLAFDKSLTNDQRLQRHNSLQKRLKRIMKEGHYPDLRTAELRLIADDLIHPLERKSKSGFVGSTNIWYRNQVHRNTECDKLVAFSKSATSYPFNDRVYLSHRATLNPIDSFFNQLRNRVTYASRNFASASENRRIWYKLSAYNPSRLYKTIQIFRTYKNYCMISDRDGMTPAQRIGLAKGPIKLNEIIG